jgi:hypothetical protein
LGLHAATQALLGTTLLWIARLAPSPTTETTKLLQTLLPTLALLSQELPQLAELLQKLLLLLLAHPLLRHPLQILGTLLKVLGADSELIEQVFGGLRQLTVQFGELLACSICTLFLAVEPLQLPIQVRQLVLVGGRQFSLTLLLE